MNRFKSSEGIFEGEKMFKFVSLALIKMAMLTYISSLIQLENKLISFKFLVYREYLCFITLCSMSSVGLKVKKVFIQGMKCRYKKNYEYINYNDIHALIFTIKIVGTNISLPNRLSRRRCFRGRYICRRDIPTSLPYQEHDHNRQSWTFSRPIECNVLQHLQ